MAEKAGFCSGVRRALYHLLDEAEQHGGGSTLGPLVHNEEVVEHLKNNSVKAVNEPSEAVGSFLAIRTHGITPKVLNELDGMKNIKIIDLTCPRVQLVQKVARELNEKGHNVIIFGNADHPEVQGLIGWADGNVTVVASLEELDALEIKTPSGLIAQTTSDPELYEKVKKLYNKKAPDGQTYNTLCPETKLRQVEVFNLAERVEALVVVGSKTSANTRALYECCRQLKPSCRITNARELDPHFLKDYSTVGVTAGASTPPWTIKEVVERMENENLETRSEEQNEEHKEEKAEEQFSFDVEVKVAQVGEQVAGKVARVTDDEVYVDIGAKTEAVLPAREVHLDEGMKLEDLFSPEDNVEVTVLEADEQEDKVIVSHKRLAKEKRLEELEQAFENEQVVEGRVKQVVSAGLVVDLGSGVEGFMPGSLVDIKYIPDFTEFQDQTLQFKIIEFNQEKGKLILSRKAIQEEEATRKKEETLNSLEVGSTITGTVKRLTNFGAFVDVGNIDGLVHISELSWERVGHPSEVLKNGEEVDVKVLDVIPEKERISLSVRKTQPDPWTKAAKELESGQIITGKVTRIVNFGAFIEIKPSVEGLAHISQLADYHVKHPSEILTEGEEVEAKILEVKPKAKRISLSVKEAREEKAPPEKEKEAEEVEDGNVTLGDVFGNLFSNQEDAEEKETDTFQANEETEEDTDAAANEEGQEEMEEQTPAAEDNEEDPDQSST
ncbi:MAG: bifunctional 4-hydroxy-3-methylbut-2-enyl diphosphate reductase/30S ribosomal protein S1 [Bacillota bacterium]